MYASRKTVKNISQYQKIFAYHYNNGIKISNNKVIEYIKSLKIPPAYKNVKINLPNKMSGPGEGKKILKGAKVYIHEKGKSGARITHIDIEHPSINKIIKPKEATSCAVPFCITSPNSCCICCSLSDACCCCCCFNIACSALYS